MNDGLIRDDEKVRRGESAKWIVPMILLLLVLALVAVVALSNRLPIPLGSTDIVLYILIALFCTLVAVSLTLTGCAERFTGMEQNIEPVAADIMAVRNEQTRLYDAILNGNEELGNRISLLEESQRFVQDGAAELANVVGKEHATLRQMVQDNKQELANSTAAITRNVGETQAGIGDLQQTGQMVSDKITAIADTQDTLKEAMLDENEQLAGQLTNLAASHRQLGSHVDTVQQLTRKVADNVTSIADQQAGLRGALQDNAHVLTDNMAVLERNQQTLQKDVNKAVEAGQQTAATVAAVAMEQTAMHERVKANNEQLTGQIGGLSEHQQTLHKDVNKAVEAGQQTVATLAAVATEQTAMHERVKANNEQLTGQIGGLSEHQQTLQAGVNSLGENTNRIAEEVVGIATEQTAMHERVKANNEQLTGQIGGLSEHQQTLQAGMNGLGENTNRIAEEVVGIATEQTAMHERVKANNEQLTGQIGGLSEHQQTLQAGMNGLGENTNRIAEEVVGVAAEQASLGEALRTHAETTDTQMSALAAGWEKFDSRVDSIQVLTQTAASSITNIADEQAALHRTLRENTLALTDNMRVVEQYHQALEGQVNNVAETGQQAADSLRAMAAEQAALQDAIVAKNEELTGRMAVLSDSQQALQAGVDSLNEKTSHVVAEAAALANGQASVGEALQTHTEAVSTQMSALAAGHGQVDGNVTRLQELAQTVAGSVANVANEQAALQRTLQDNTRVLTDNIEFVQQTLQTGMGGLDEKAIQIAADIGSVAAEQTALHEAVETEKQQLTGKLMALMESQLTFHAGVNNLSEKTNHVVAEVTGVAAEQTSLSEALQAHIEAVSTQMSTLAASHGQVESNVNHLRELAQTAAGNVTRIADEQTELHRTLQDNTQVLSDGMQALNDGMAGVMQDQQTIRTEVSTAAQSSEKATAAVSTMANEQAALRETVKTGSEELTGQLVVLSDSQRALHAGINSLGERTNHVAGEVSGLATEQASLNEALQAHAEAVKAQISTLATSHGQVDDNVNRLGELTQTVASNVTDIADEQTAVHRTLRDNTQVLKDNMDVVAQNQQALRAEVGKVTQSSQQAVAAMTAMTAEQAALHEATSANNEELSGQLSALSEDQHMLRVEVNKVTETAQQTFAQMNTMTAHQAALHETVKTDSRELTGQIAGLSEGQQALRAGVNSLGEKTNQAVAGVAGVAAEQAALSEALQAHNEVVNTQISALAAGHGQVDGNVNRLQELTQTVAGEVANIANEQTALHRTLEDGTEVLNDNMEIVAQNQQALQAEVGKVAQSSQQTVATVTTIAAGQTALHEAVSANNEELSGQLSTLSENQHTLRVEVSKVAGTSQETAATVTAMAAGQAALHETVKTNGEELNGQISTLSREQHTLCAGISSLDEKATQMTVDIGSAAKEQATLHQQVQNNTKELADRIAVTTQNQQRMQTGIGEFLRTSQAVSDKITTVAETQDTLKEMMHQANEQLVDRVTTLTANHGQLHSNVNSLRELTQRVAGSVTSITDEQAAQHKTLQDNTQVLTDNTVTVEQNQKTLQTELNKVAETGRQAAATVTAMAAQQTALLKTMSANNEELTGQIMALSESQQTSLDTLNAIGKQAATDLTAIDGRQIELEQAVQANREDLIAKLATITQGQQRWLEQFDAAQTKIHTMVANIGTLEQKVVHLQESLQRNVQDLADLLDTKSEQRIQFEERVNQDLTAIISSVSQIQEARVSLQAQMQAVQDGSQTRSEDITWAIDQLKQQVAERKLRQDSEELGPDGPDRTVRSVTEGTTYPDQVN